MTTDNKTFSAWEELQRIRDEKKKVVPSPLLPSQPLQPAPQPTKPFSAMEELERIRSGKDIEGIEQPTLPQNIINLSREGLPRIEYGKFSDITIQDNQGFDVQARLAPDYNIYREGKKIGEARQDLSVWLDKKQVGFVRPQLETIQAEVRPDNTVWFGSKQVGSLKDGEFIPKPDEDLPEGLKDVPKWAMQGVTPPSLEQVAELTEYAFLPFTIIGESILSQEIPGSGLIGKQIPISQNIQDSFTQIRESREYQSAPLWKKLDMELMAMLPGGSVHETYKDEPFWKQLIGELPALIATMGIGFSPSKTAMQKLFKQVVKAEGKQLRGKTLSIAEKQFLAKGAKVEEAVGATIKVKAPPIVKPTKPEVIERINFLEKRLAEAEKFEPAKRPPTPPTTNERADLIQEATQEVADAKNYLARARKEGAGVDDIASLKDELASAMDSLRDAKKPFDTIAYEKAIAVAKSEDVAINTQVKKLADELARLKATTSPVTPKVTRVAPIDIAAEEAVNQTIQKKNAPTLAKVEAMWLDEESRLVATGVEKAEVFWRTVEEKLTDKFAGINKITSRAKATWKKERPGEEFPIELDAELHASLLGGSAAAGGQRATDTFKAMKGVLGNKIPVRHVDSYLHLKHNLDVLKMHPKRKVSGGLLGKAEVDEALEQMRVFLGDEAFLKVEQASNVITEHYATYLQRGVDSGLVSKELAALLRETYPNYNPIKYIERIALGQEQGAGKAMSVTRNDIRTLSELGKASVRERPLDTLMSASMQKETLLHRNNTAKSISRLVEQDQQFLEQIKRLPDSGKGTLSFMEGGIRKDVVVPKWLESEAKLLANLNVGDLEKLGMVLNAASRFGMTTANLAFFVPNMAVDSLTSMIGYGVSPGRLGKRLLLNLKDLVKEDKVLAEIRRSGGEVFGFWGKTPDELIRKAKKEGVLLLENRKSWRDIMKSPFETIAKIGHAVEMTPRSAVFELELKRGRTIEYAALAARRSTIDFQRSGTAIRQANSLFLYLNAGVQGSLIPFRAIRDIPQARLRVAGYMGAVAGTYAWNRQFPEYEDIPDYYKYNAIPIMLPSEEYDNRGNKVPHYILVVPNLREWSLFSGPLVYAMRKLDKKNTGDFGEFLSEWLPPLNPASQILGQGVLPVPTQIGQALTEISFNYDSFRQRPIVSAELSVLPNNEQYDEWTTLTARRMGDAIGLSPLKLDFLIRNIFGGVGSQALSATDRIISAIEGESVDSRIQILVNQLESIQESAQPDKIPALRKDFLESLTPTDREAVLKLESHPEDRVPIATDIWNRIYKERGGQIYETAKTNAQKILDNDKSLETAQEELSQKALQNASNFINGKINNSQYRAILSDDRIYASGRKAESWRMRELLGAITSSDVQPYLPEEYQWKPEEKALNSYFMIVDRLFTELAGVETDENVSNLWRQVDNYIQTLPEDMQVYIKNHKSDWINDLPPEVQLVQRTYETDMDYVAQTGYWDLLTTTEQREQGLTGKQVVDNRGVAREQLPELDAILNFWYDYYTTIKTQQAMNILVQKAFDLNRSYDNIPAMQEKVQKASSAKDILARYK